MITDRAIKMIKEVMVINNMDLDDYHFQIDKRDDELFICFNKEESYGKILNIDGLRVIFGTDLDMESLFVDYDEISDGRKGFIFSGGL